MQSVYISDLFSFSLGDLSRTGLLADPGTSEEITGTLTLTQTRGYLGKKTSVSFEVTTQSNGLGGGYLSLRYYLDRKWVSFGYDLERKESNLPSGGYYFVISHQRRRGTKLYLWDGVFLPRWELPPGIEYGSQAESKYWRGLNRDGNIAYFERLFQKYRKVHYRGNLTPYGDKITRSYNQIRNWSYTLCQDRRIRRTLEVWEENLPPGTILRTYPRYVTRFEKRLGI